VLSEYELEAEMDRSKSSRSPHFPYGRSLAEKLGLEDAPAIVTRTLGQAEIAVTDIHVINPSGTLSAPLPRVNAYGITLVMNDVAKNSYWECDRQVSSASVQAGQILISDMRREPRVLMDRPFHSVLFYLPKNAIDALTDLADVPRIDELQYEPGVGISDETMKHLGLSLMPAFRAPDQANRLFMDYVTLAFASHAAKQYGGIRTLSKPLKGGLAPWQERLSKELITNNLAGAISLSEIAKTCGLSVGHFSRAFRKSTGLAPHAWLLQARVDTAKIILRDRDASLSEIAHSCGFVDRSHFTRVFTRLVGLSPRAWSKLVR
jgi:AraC family transcriptional regulator